MARRERTVFDGIEPSDALYPKTVSISATLIRCWEESLADYDEKIAALMKARAAHVRNIASAKKAVSLKGRK